MFVLHDFTTHTHKRFRDLDAAYDAATLVRRTHAWAILRLDGDDPAAAVTVASGRGPLRVAVAS